MSGGKLIQPARRILVIDDDEGVLQSFKSILTLKGYSVDVAATGYEAIEKSRMYAYDLALIDVKLPDMEGTELLTKMREIEPVMKKIIITGYSTEDNLHESLQRADAFIRKPVELSELLNIINQKLGEQGKPEVQVKKEKNINA